MPQILGHRYSFLALCAFSTGGLGLAAWSFGRGEILTGFLAIIFSVLFALLGYFFAWNASESQIKGQEKHTVDGWSRVQSRSEIQPMAKVHSRVANRGDARNAHPWAGNMKK